MTGSMRANVDVSTPPTSSVAGVAPLLAPSVLLPSQGNGSTRGSSPEIHLVAALLEDAVQCVLRNATADQGPRLRDFVEAYNWLHSDARDWPFTFVNVCDLFALDAAAVRERVVKIVNARRRGKEVRHFSLQHVVGGAAGVAPLHFSRKVY